MLFNISTLSAQIFATSNININGLTLGHKIPDLRLENIVNFRDKNTTLSSFRGKLLILDFWATWCSPCIASFPKLDSLQKQFDGKIQIMPVTRESEKLVSDFFVKIGKHLKVIPFSVTNDVILNNYFKHTYLPHYVWIDSNGQLLAITEGEEVNIANIKSVLEGRSPQFKIKKDAISSIVHRGGVPLFKTAIEMKVDTSIQYVPLKDSQTVKYSLFTRYVDGILAGSRADAPNLVIGENLSIKSLYKLAFWGTSLYIANSTDALLKVDIKDENLFKISCGLNPDGSRLLKAGAETTEWRKKYAYCYQLVVPEFLATKRFDIMLEDLNQFFGALYDIEGVKEKRKVKYLALIKKTNNDLIATKGGQPIERADKLSVEFKNVNLSSLVAALVIPLQGYPPIVDETNYSGNVDLKLDCQLSNLNEVNKELDKYGLKLQEEEKEMEVGVIRDKKSIQ
jgi:thiol-disulfide isomerase/thioredoxin